jgi:hypothetical protein
MFKGYSITLNNSVPISIQDCGVLRFQELTTTLTKSSEKVSFIKRACDWNQQINVNCKYHDDIDIGHGKFVLIDSNYNLS